ncbi:MAG: hypothetical protein PWR28_712 [Synergistaceae bacterium]|nr:hypothetical protein [Synergistaceae bacterium]
MRTSAARQQIIPAVVKTFLFCVKSWSIFYAIRPEIKASSKGCLDSARTSTLRFDHLYLLRYNPT